MHIMTHLRVYFQRKNWIKMLKIKSIFKFKNGQFWKKKWRWDAQLITHKDVILIFENRWRPLQQWLIILHIKNHRYSNPTVSTLNIEIVEINKNVFHSNANCPLANRCMNKSHQVHGEARGSHVTCDWPMASQVVVKWGTPLPLWTEWQTNLTENITFLAGGNNEKSSHYFKTVLEEFRLDM